MATEEKILQDLGMDDLAGMREEADQFLANSFDVIKSQSTATTPYVDFAKLQSAALAEREMSPEDKMLFDVDSLYSSGQNYTHDPNDRPEFDAVRKNRYAVQKDSLRDDLRHSMQNKPLPARGDEEFTVLKRDLRELHEMNKEATKQGRTFGQVWMDKVDTSKMSYLEQTKLSMQARQYELMLNNKMSSDEAKRQVNDEYSETFSKLKDDPVYMERMLMTPEQETKAFVSNLKQVDAYMKDTARFEKMPEQQLKEAQYAAGLFADIATSFVPIVGTGSGLYMAATGDDIFINAFTGEDHKLPMWARPLMILPIVGPLYRAIRHPARTTGRVVDTVKKVMGADVGDMVLRSGPNKLRGVLNQLKETGQGNLIDDILIDIKNGDIKVADDEITLVNILRSISDNNTGTARAILRAGSPPDSPMLQLAKHAVANNDKRARQEIIDTILNVGDDASTDRAKALMDVLGADSDDMHMLLRDIRNVSKPDGAVTKAEQTILEGRRQIEIKKARLENLKKAREAAAEKRTVTAAKVAKEKAEVTARAESPS
jgi:hypothetical protein